MQTGSDESEWTIYETFEFDCLKCATFICEEHIVFGLDNHSKAIMY